MDCTVAGELRFILVCKPPLHRRSFSPQPPPRLPHIRSFSQFSLRAKAGEHQPTVSTAAQTLTFQACPRLHLDTQANKQWVHFIGIGGAGLSALAFYALKQGWHVTGSDISWSKKLEDLKKAGAEVHVGHQESQIWRHKRGAWLARVTHGYDLIAVSGSHGKSTTTAMLSTVLKDMGNDISAILGADVPQWPGGGSVMYGDGNMFILEADEYDGCFLSLSPQVALITNIEWEHVDIFPNEDAVKDYFRKFCKRLKTGGALIFCGDNDAAKSVAGVVLSGDVYEDEGDSKQRTKTLHKVISYGLGEGNTWQARMIAPNSQGGSDYVATCNGEAMTDVQLRIPGAHNVLNSLAVIVTAAVLASQKDASDSGPSLAAQKESAKAASRSLQGFLGLRRRFEFVGAVKGCQIYDDYAHHPTEIRALLEAAKQQFGRQPVWLVFQPHTFSRLSALLGEFATTLTAADRVIVTEIYSARENNVWGISGKDLVNQIQNTPAVYVPGSDDVCAYLVEELAAVHSHGHDENDVIIFTVGAGDISTLGPKLLQSLLRANSAFASTSKYVG